MTQSSGPPGSATLLRIGTRGSPLALVQAEAVRAGLAAAHGLDPNAIAITSFQTSGDRIQDRTLAEAGGKGLFTKEIDEALLAGRVDLAVHSAKDLPTWIPAGIVLAAFLPREDVHDVLVSHAGRRLHELAPGAVVGTASLRRQAQVLRLRPDLRVVPFRGNVDTRLRKLAAGEAAATLLALAGLKRLGRDAVATAILPLEDFLPAVGQGAIAVAARANDTRVLDLLAALDHHDTAAALALERAFLAVLDGSCRTPIAGHAVLVDGQLRFRGEIVRPDGRGSHAAERSGATADAVALGGDAGRELRAAAPPGFFGD